MEGCKLRRHVTIFGLEELGQPENFLILFFCVFITKIARFLCSSHDSDGKGLGKSIKISDPVPRKPAARRIAGPDRVDANAAAKDRERERDGRIVPLR